MKSQLVEESDGRDSSVVQRPIETDRDCLQLKTQSKLKTQSESLIGHDLYWSSDHGGVTFI